MNESKKVILQTARVHPVISMFLAVLITGGVILFLPISVQHQSGWWGAVFLVSFLGVYFGLSLKTQVIEEKADDYVVLIPDHSSNTVQRIPLTSITHVTQCDYKMFKQHFESPEWVTDDYFYCKSLFGYAGKGLIICYQLQNEPLIHRAIAFPAPKADSFISFIKAKS